MNRSAGVSVAKQKGFADELDRRVAQRTAELTATIEQLKRELAGRQRARETLREGELFKLIVESIPVPVAITSPTGEIEALNKPTLEYFGRTFEELKGWKSSDVVHPDDLQRTVATQIEALQTGSAYNVESRHRRADGIYRWFNVLGLPLRDSQGHILCWFILQIDIDDRKRAEAQLAGEKRLLEMVASGHVLTDVLTELCKFVEEIAGDCQCGVYLIDWRTATFRRGAAPSLPSTFNDPVEGLTVTSDAGPCGVAALTRSQVLVTDIDVDSRFQKATIRPLLLAHGLHAHWSTPIYSRDGQVLGTFAIFQDHPSSPTQLQLDLISQVTHIASIAIERASSEEALKRSELQFKTIFDEAGAGITLVDLKNAAPIQNNRALRKMLGCTQEELGRFETFDRLTHEDEREKDATTFRELCAGQRDSLRLEKHFVLRDGRSIWANVIFTLLRDDENKPRYVIAIHEDFTERKLALERLQQHQELLDLAQKSARATAFDWYIQQEVNYWSPEQEALYGLAPGSFDGTYQSWKEMIYAPDWPGVVDSIKHAHETGEVAAEFRAIWPDGSLHWLSTIGRMFFDEAGEPLRMVGFTSDVTRRKLIEEELRRSEAFLAQAQQLSRTGSFSWRVATNEITWSDELYRIYEIEMGTRITLDLIRTRVHPEDLTLYEKMLVQAQNGADDFEWQYRLLMPDQSIKYMQAVARATRNDDGRLEYLAAVQDITRRRLIEEEMRRSEAFLAEGQNLARMGNFWWRVRTSEIVWSEPMYRIFEFEPGTTVTLERIASRVHPDDMPSLADMIERAERGEDFEYEHRIVMPDGSVKYLHLIAHRTRDGHHGLEYIGAVQDISQRRLSEEALSKARSELAHVARVMSLGTLTASIAHEVNQPLSGIITNASTCVRMLDADPPNIDGARETARRTIRDGRRAADVIIGLRALFARKDNVTELMDLNEATREVIALSRSELEHNRVIIKTDLAAQLPLITGDRVQLQQVIMNLLRNGSDAMIGVDDRPRELLFRTEIEEGDRVRLSVQDSGIGFSGQSLEQLFQSFYTTKDDGMGIGLSVSRSIIENHQGRLSATRNDGPGVTFSFSIPRAIDGTEIDSP